MLSLIGFPDFLYNDTKLDEYYENFTLDSTDHYALQVEKASIWAQKKAFRRLIEEVDREEFGTSSAVVNAFYSGVKNAISSFKIAKINYSFNFSIPCGNFAGALL